MKSTKSNEPSFIQKVIIVCVAVLVIYLLINIENVWSVLQVVFGVIMPVFLGVCIAFVLNPVVKIYNKFLLKLVNKLSKKNLKFSLDKTVKSVSIFLAIITVLLFFTLVLFIAVPEIIDAFNILKVSFPPVLQNCFDWLYDTALNLGVTIEHFSVDNMNWNVITEYLSKFFTAGSLSDLLSNIPGAISSVVTVVFNIVIGIVFAISILGNKNRIFKFLDKWMNLYLKPTTHKSIDDILSLVTDSFRNFVTGQLTEAAILFVLCVIGMNIFGFPYVVATSAIIAITALVPMFGAWIGGAIGALLALTASPLKMVFFVIFLVVLNLIDNYIVYPKVVGNQLKMPSLVVMISVVVGGNLAGIVGMIFGVPIVSVVYVLINRAVDGRAKAYEEAQALNAVVTEAALNASKKELAETDSDIPDDSDLSN